MKNKHLMNIKELYEQIEIPSELNASIETGIERGRKELKRRKNNGNTALKISSCFIIIFTLFTASINILPSFADTIKGIPIVGKLVEVLQFTEGKSGGGKITDGTDVSNISLMKENGYENIMINFSQGDKLQKDVGAFQVSYEENPYTMSFEIGGVREISAKESFQKFLESKYVKDVYPIITLDDSLIRFVIEFKGPVKYEVKEMKEPASIMIRLSEDQQLIEKKRYSLRTRSYPYGEPLGILEEKLMALNPTRILKDAEGLYFIELQIFDTKEDALRRLDEIKALNYDAIFMEERMANDSPKSYPVEAQSKLINESLNTSPGGLNGEGNAAENTSRYPVSINENNENYYGTIELLDKGLNIYGEDINAKAKYYFLYKDITLTKLRGEAAFKLKIEAGDKTIIASGAFSDFFEELEKYAKVK